MHHDRNAGIGFPAKPVLAALGAAAICTAALCADVLGAPALQSATAVCDVHHLRDASLMLAAGSLAGLTVLARRDIATRVRTLLARLRRPRMRPADLVGCTGCDGSSR